MKSSLLAISIALAIGSACTPEPTPVKEDQFELEERSPPIAAEVAVEPDSQMAVGPEVDTLPPIDYDTTQWAELVRLDPSIVLDIRYATANNFVGVQLYDCGRCWLRPKVARAIVTAHRELGVLGYGLKLFDCYRPRPYQQRLWDKMPDARYVARPSRGSVHNRGAAVDLTVVERISSRELAMGTDYDYFGPEGHSAYAELPDSVLAHRRLLQETMRRNGFLPIRTEWWHFDFAGPRYPLSDELWTCPANSMEGNE